MTTAARTKAVHSAIARRLRRLSLRARLALGLVAVATVGLVVADVIVYSEIQSYLYGQVDQELSTALNTVVNELRFGAAGPPDVFHFQSDTAAGTYGAFVDPGGTALQTSSAVLLGPPPVMPKPLRTAPTSTAPLTFTTGAVGRPSFQYRVLAQPARLQAFPQPATVGYAVVAIPLTSLDSTLSQLVTVDIIVTAVLLLALAGIGYLVVRVGMRPLAEIEATAGAIAAGDLSRRVEQDDPRTEIGRLGASLNEMLAKIEHAFSERQASEDRLRQFLADASHELRTPITSIRGYSELFRRGASTRPGDLAASMRRIEDEATRMGILVDDLLLLARLDQGRPLEQVPVDLAGIAAEVVADAQILEPARPIEFAAPGPVLVSGDEPRLRQVVSNLVGNALKHTPPGTPLSVSVDDASGRARLAVADAGPGVPVEHRERIFERFYRVDPSRTREHGGAGLGLSIVASIAEAHGGKARLEVHDGPGASFVVELPLAEADPDLGGASAPLDPAQAQPTN